MSHGPKDSIYGAIFDELVCQAGSDLTKPQEDAVAPAMGSPGVELPAPAFTPSALTGAPLTGSVLPPVHRAQGTLVQRCTEWLSSRTGIQTTATSLGIPSLIWLLSEVSAAQSPLWTGGAAVLSLLGGTALSFWSLDRGFGSKTTLAGVGIATAGLQIAMSAAPSPWSGFVGWIISASGAAALRVTYANGRKEPEAKVRILEGQARLVDAKTLRELHRAEAAMHKAALDRLKLQMALATAAGPATDHQPFLGGATAEESMVRQGFWHGLKTELLYVNVEMTLTGWKATIGLPVSLARSAARSGWDKVASAMSVDGRFALADGRRSNEIEVRCIESGKSGGIDSTWHRGLLRTDGRASLGYDTETGAEVLIELNKRFVWAGCSGSGKSWSLRNLMAAAHHVGHVVFFDPKGDETYGAWGDVVRCAVEPEELIALVIEVHAEMLRRRDEMKERRISVWDRQQLTVVTDENQDMLYHLQSKASGGGEEIMQMYRRISSQGRSRGVVLTQATQKPTYGSRDGGLDTQMAGNVDARFSLRVATEQESRNVLDAYAEYAPHLIDKSPTTQGQGYLAGYGATLIQSWKVTDEMVRSLPPKIWRGSDAVRAEMTPHARVAEYLEMNPGASGREVARKTGVPESSVRVILKGL